MISGDQKSRRTPSFSGLTSASTAASTRARASSRRRDTRPEILLRKALHRIGLRYRVDARDLPGCPDIVFRKARVAVFVDGDFWHGRDLDERTRKLRRGHNAEYWMAKIEGNVARDRVRERELQRQGWAVLRFWETDIRRDTGAALRAIRETVKARCGKVAI